MKRSPRYRLHRFERQPYAQALALQLRLVDGMIARRQREGPAQPVGADNACSAESRGDAERFIPPENHLILTEHDPVYTLGRRGRMQDVLARHHGADKIPVIESDRGGEVTYHGPGQLVIYLVRDLGAEQGVRDHVQRLESLVIDLAASLGIRARRRTGYPGVWVEGAKLAALGVRVRRSVAYHGIAINRDPDLSHFAGIVPCGIPDGAVTSLAALGIEIQRTALERRVVDLFAEHFPVDVLLEA